MGRQPTTVRHLHLHVSVAELDAIRKFFYSKGIALAQEVVTQGHTNPNIRDSRRYHYVIFDTRSILGVDLKFIERLELVKDDGIPPGMDSTPVQEEFDKRGSRIGNVDAQSKIEFLSTNKRVCGHG